MSKYVRLKNNFFISLILFLYLCSFCSSKLSNSLRQETNVVTVKPQPSSITNDFGSNNKFFDDPENKFFYRRYIKCTNINCPPPHTCVDNTVCKCGENFADLGRNVDIYCAHNQRQQITAFLLELVFPFGIGHLYCGRYLIGFIKLVWYMFPAIMIIFMVMKKMKFSSGANNDNQCLLFTVLALCCGLSLWQLVDLIKFGFNKYRDGWGVPLKPFI